MPVGDITSDEPGSGARYNDGKPVYGMVPAVMWRTAFKGFPKLQKAADHLWRVTQWSGETKGAVPGYEYQVDDLVQASAVFEYGARKYEAWNWAKGMPWSVPLNCALRHMAAIALGEEKDPESGLLHWGHVVCNLVMLDWYVQFYHDGNDLEIPLCRIS
jgi:hypothetical protein